MIEFLGRWLTAVWEILALSGPWLLVGFVLAGLLRIVLPGLGELGDLARTRR